MVWYENQIFNQTYTSMENIPVHIIPCVVCVPVCVFNRGEKGTPSRPRSWVWVQYPLFSSQTRALYWGNKRFLPDTICHELKKWVLLSYLNSPDLYRLLSRSWPCLPVCTPWSGCQWWGSCTEGTPQSTGSRTGCPGRCIRPPHCTWCNSRQTGQTSLVNIEGRWSGDLEREQEGYGRKKVN